MTLPPIAICQCGCNEEIAPKPHHRYKPAKFLYGHWARVRKNTGRLVPPPEVIPLLTGVCGCGCGQPTVICTVSRPKQMQYKGYPNRFLHNHHPKDRRGEKCPRWRGGRTHDGNNYIRVYRPEHQMASSIGYVPEHRMIFSDSLGRPLESYEHIHHKNGDRADNRLENLELLCVGFHPIGQRAEDLVAWARQVLSKYGHLFPEDHR